MLVYAERQFNPDKILKTICVCRVTDLAQQDTGKICNVILEKNGDIPQTTITIVVTSTGFLVRFWHKAILRCGV